MQKKTGYLLRKRGWSHLLKPKYLEQEIKSTNAESPFHVQIAQGRLSKNMTLFTQSFISVCFVKYTSFMLDFPPFLLLNNSYMLGHLWPIYPLICSFFLLDILLPIGVISNDIIC